MYDAIIDKESKSVSIKKQADATGDVEVYKVNTGETVEYRIMNESALSESIILQKVNEDRVPLEGARFRIFKINMDEVTENQPVYKESDTLPDGKHVGDRKGYYESGKRGAYFIGELPVGTYYIVEIKEPSKENSIESDEYSENIGKVYEMKIQNGIHLTELQTTNTLNTDAEPFKTLKSIVGEL